MKKSTAYIVAGSFCIIASAIMLLLGWQYHYFPEMLIISGALFVILISVFMFDNYTQKYKEDRKNALAGRLYIKCSGLCKYDNITENVILRAYDYGIIISGLKTESDLMYYENITVSKPSKYCFEITHKDTKSTTDIYSITIDDNLSMQALSQTLADKNIIMTESERTDMNEEKTDNIA